jgi:glycerol uptake facilitator-like aquaporin
MPRETNTSLFESHVTQGLFLIVCLIGIILVILILQQNYKSFRERRDRSYVSDEIEKSAKRAARHDFSSSLIIGLLIITVLVILIVTTGIKLL